MLASSVVREVTMRRPLNSLLVLPGVIFLSVMVLSACGASDGINDTSPEIPAYELQSNKQRTTSPVVSRDDAATFANDNLAFSVDLYHAIRSKSSGNFIFSQTSISAALAMLYAGA